MCHRLRRNRRRAASSNPAALHSRVHFAQSDAECARARMSPGPPAGRARVHHRCLSAPLEPIKIDGGELCRSSVWLRCRSSGSDSSLCRYSAAHTKVDTQL